MHVTACAKAGTVTIQAQGANAVTTTKDSVIAKLKPGFWPGVPSPVRRRHGRRVGSHHGQHHR